MLYYGAMKRNEKRFVDRESFIRRIIQSFKTPNNVKVFKETLRVCRDEGYEIAPFKVIPLPTIDEVIAKTVVWTRLPSVKAKPGGIGKGTAEVEVVNQDTAVAGKSLRSKGYNPAILNMASCWQPGGGVFAGALTQEESLFRRSNLCMSLFPLDEASAKKANMPFAQQYYPDRSRHYDVVNGDDPSRKLLTILSKDVVFFRDTEIKGCQFLKRPYLLDVITCAAIKKPKLNNGKLYYNDKEIVRRKIRSMFQMAQMNGNDALVLGAWGCGAYQNPIEDIAEIFKKEIARPRYKGVFKRIVFAIYGTSLSGSIKREMFRTILSGETEF